jgi:hypothetical protein
MQEIPYGFSFQRNVLMNLLDCLFFFLFTAVIGNGKEIQVINKTRKCNYLGAHNTVRNGTQSILLICGTVWRFSGRR